jgi:hypothetical protein
MLKKLGLSLVALVAVASIAVAGGAFFGYPIVGGASYCASTNNGNCVSTIAAGPTALTGNETIPMDTLLPQGIQPQTVSLPSSLLAGGIGGTTVSTTTGTTALVQMADLTSTYIYAGAGTATFTSFKLPSNPANNAKACLANAGSGILTLTAVAAGTNNAGNTPTITGVAPTSLPVATAVGTAGTVTLSSNCWLYQSAANNTGVWYRVQ